MDEDLRAKLRALVSKWRKQWEGGDIMTRTDGSTYVAGGDRDDYYAGQYSRAEEHADELEAVLKECS